MREAGRAPGPPHGRWLGRCGPARRPARDRRAAEPRPSACAEAAARVRLMAGPTTQFWQERFESGQTPWDRGEAHPQLLRWIEQGLIAAGMSLVLPGCGRGHELPALGRAGVAAIGL